MGLDYEFMDMCDVLDEEHKQYRLQLKSIYKALKHEKWQKRKFIRTDLFEGSTWLEFKGVISQLPNYLTVRDRQVEGGYIGHNKVRYTYYVLQHSGYSGDDYNGTLWIKLRNGKYLVVGYAM